ncbi:MAG: oxidoreductase FAD/NAD(P)-binding domain-containing protein, partial [Promethearchaeota archaeon CR_4]
MGGGIGIAAITTVVDELKATGKNVWVAIGARNKASLIFEKRLRALDSDCCCTTDDGSVGQKCFVTDPVADIIAKQKIDLILTCGPEMMMKE